MDKKKPKLVYISQDGSYGEAVGMFLFNPNDLGDEGWSKLQNALDNGENLHAWLYRTYDEGVDLKPTLHVINENGFVVDAGVTAGIGSALEMMGRGDIGK